MNPALRHRGLDHHCLHHQIFLPAAAAVLLLVVVVVAAAATLLLVVVAVVAAAVLLLVVVVAAGSLKTAVAHNRPLKAIHLALWIFGSYKMGSQVLQAHKGTGAAPNLTVPLSLQAPG